MDLRKSLFLVIAVGVIAAAAAVPSGAHNGPASCVLAASPALVNNVEMGPPSPNTNPMNPAAVGHSLQKRGDGNRFGLYYPALDPNQDHWTSTGPTAAPPNNEGILPSPHPLVTKGDNFNWRQTGSCAGQTNVNYSASGTGIGYCGRSVGFGTGTITGGHSTIIRWESLGTQLILADTTPNRTVIGSVNAQANPPGSPNGSCLDGGAAVFVVDGVLVHM